MDAANEAEAEGGNNEAEGDADEELEKLKKKWQEMEEEASKLKEISEAEAEDGNAEQAEIDARSVYVGQCDYNATPEELQAHFQSCGTINRVTIICDKYSGHSKGFATHHLHKCFHCRALFGCSTPAMTADFLSNLSRLFAIARFPR